MMQIMSDTKELPREGKDAAHDRKSGEVIQRYLDDPKTKTADAVYYVTAERAEMLKEYLKEAKIRMTWGRSGVGRSAYLRRRLLLRNLQKAQKKTGTTD